MAPLPAAPSTVNHYTVLGLPQTPSALRKTDIKLAYHRALLKYHPDKSRTSTSNQQSPQCSPGDRSSETQCTFTIDEITTAYKILSDPVSRAEYDRSLRLRPQDNPAFGEGDDDASFRTGLEIFDLDDMEIEMRYQETDQSNGDSGQSVWYRGCRCGDEKGFMVREEDLEREIERGEVLVGCRGCSLWAKIVFAVEEEETRNSGKT
ncbi:hypothetical protein VTO42DRAFT_1308 [Malbranchea cinnamomea]